MIPPTPLPQPAYRYRTCALRPNWPFLGLLILLGALIPLFVFGGFIVDDFEEHDLGNLTGQGHWEGGTTFQVVDTKPFTGLQSVHHAQDSSRSIRYYSEDPSGTGSFVFFDWFVAGMAGAESYSPLVNIVGCKTLAPTSCYILGGAQIEHNAGQWDFGYRVGAIFTPTSEDIGSEEWHFIGVEWDLSVWKFRVKINSEDWSNWITFDEEDKKEEISEVKSIMVYTKLQELWIDDFVEEYSPELEIIGIAPDSGTEITDFESNLTIQYKYFDWEVHNGFIVNFKDSKIGGLANSVLFEKDDLDPSGTGQEIINLADFGIDSNGRWDLTGLGFGTKIDIQGGMFLTTRGYIDFWTDQLVLDPYYLIINVEGLPDFYVFTDASTWYGVNVDRFDDPTAFFTSVVGLMTPTFEKLGEFGRRTSGLLDANESYDRGYSLGEVFPLINAYIKKIDLFFGGFPLASFFKYLILLMFAGFIIRTILKFIPTLG